jgi:ribose transport system permease protein
VLIGGLDVSVAGWILAGATTSVELLGGTGTRWPAWQVFLVLGVGSLLVGGLVGFICHRYLVPALVLTLATGAMVTGAVLAWKRGFVTGVPPQWLANLSSPGGKTLGIALPPVVFIWAVVTIVFFVVLRRTVAGTWVYATGNNPRAADLALVPTTAVWAAVFALSAFSACMAGVLLAGFAAGGDASIGEPYMWNGITAVIVGGTAFGARGDYLRTVLGTLLLIVLAQVMIGHGFDYADQTILYGALILVVVGIYGRDRRLRDQV